MMSLSWLVDLTQKSINRWKNGILWMSMLVVLDSCEQPAANKQVLIERSSYYVMDAYWLYLPEGYDPSKKYPTIVYLQGGEMAASPNPETVRQGGPVVHALQGHIEASKFIIINPHMTVGPRNQRQWYHHTEELVSVIDEVNKEFQIDPTRIYLTGPSKGALGVFGVAKRRPDLFAATVPIAGRIGCENNCEKLIDHPLWIIHNKNDAVVTSDYSKNVVNYFESDLNIEFTRTSSIQLLDLSADKIFTLLKGNSHDAWSETYESGEFYQWLLSKYIQNDR